MNLYAIRLLYLRELRSALRERSIVIGSLLVPLLLYPVLLWLAFTAITFLQGQEERFVSRVAVTGLPPEHRQLADEIAALESMAMLPAPDAGSIEAAVAGGAVDAVAEILPAAAEDAGLADNFRVRLIYDSSEDRSVKARRRLVAAVDAYRERWIREQAAGLGVDDRAFDGIRVERLDLATSGERGAFLLGMLVPLLMIIMIAVGCFYPAVDSIAGERERSTWETSLTLGVPRRTLVIAKYLYVATMGAVSGLLNLVGITAAAAVLIRSKGLGKGELEVSVPMPAIPVIVLGTLVLALLVAALCLMLVPLARTYKEGQALASPVLLVVLFPAMAAGMPIDTVELGVAAIPIANVMMTFKMALAGHFPADFIALAFASTLATVALLLWLATRFIDNETLMLGEFEGSPVKVLQRWWKGRK